MALYQQKWWKKIFQKESRLKKAEMLTDVQAMRDFLTDAPQDVRSLQHLLDQLEELEKERQIATESLLATNLHTQEEIMDKLMERYDFFQNDVDINGIRLQRIAQEFLKNLGKAELKELAQEKKHQWRLK